MMNLQETIKRILREEKKPSNFLLRRLDMLDYEVEKNFYGQPLGGSNICIFFKSDIEYFETIMENSIDAMYYNYFSHIDDNSGGWAHEYLDMVNYIRKKYQYKIMKHYDDNCGSGSIPLKESIRKVLKESIDKFEDKKLKVITKIIHEFFDEVSFIEIKKYENKPMIIVYFDNDEDAANEETYFAEQIQDKIYEYTGIKLIPYWRNIQYNTDADFRLDAIKLKYDNLGNVIN